MDQETIFANHIDSRGSVSRICKELSNFNSKMKKKSKDVKFFTEEDMQMVNKHKEK